MYYLTALELAVGNVGRYSQPMCIFLFLPMSSRIVREVRLGMFTLACTENIQSNLFVMIGKQGLKDANDFQPRNLWYNFMYNMKIFHISFKG